MKATSRPLPYLSYLLMVLSLVSCRSYQLSTDHYIVRGDNNFISRSASTKVFLGPVLTSDLWEDTHSPVNSERPEKKHYSLLNRLGYHKNSHKILFTNDSRTAYDLIGVVYVPTDNRSVQKRQLRLINRLTKKTTDEGEWYYEVVEHEGKSYYHALIPYFNYKILDQSVTLIYGIPDGQGVEDFERLVAINASAYQTPGIYPSDMIPYDCGIDTATRYHHYYVPISLSQSNQSLSKKESRNDYIIKAFRRGQVDDLVYYRLLQIPPITQGAFRVCPGAYTLQYTTLKGEVLWTEDFDIE